MSAESTERHGPGSTPSVRTESDRKVYRESRGSPSGTPGRAGKGNSEYGTATSRARGDVGPDTLNEKSEAIWAEQREWVTSKFPDLPRDWIDLFMLALGRARRGGVRNPSYDQLVAWLKREGWPTDELPERVS